MLDSTQNYRRLNFTSFHLTKFLSTVFFLQILQIPHVSQESLVYPGTGHVTMTWGISTGHLHYYVWRLQTANKPVICSYVVVCKYSSSSNSSQVIRRYGDIPLGASSLDIVFIVYCVLHCICISSWNKIIESESESISPGNVSCI